MAFNYTYTSAFNAYVPAATGQVISYTRDPASYSVNKYVQLVPATKGVFVWFKYHPDDMGQRMPSTLEQVWADGAERPRNPQNTSRFQPVEGQVIRRNYDFQIGWQALDDADLPILTQHTLMARNQRMTAFTQRVVTLLTTASNWPATNVVDVNVANGGAGKWSQASSDSSSPHFLAIKKSLDYAAIQIGLLTNGAVNFKKDPGRLVISPNCARIMSETDEIHNYIRESPFALAQIRGREPGQNSIYGLPDQLYSWELVIEDASIVTERPQASGGAATTAGGAFAPRRYVWPDASPAIITRVGGIDGLAGAPSFSTVQVFFHPTEVTLEVQDFPWDKLTRGSVVELVSEQLPAGEAGFLFQNAI